jgi:hypothetical protein
MGEVLLDILMISIVESPRCSLTLPQQRKDFGKYPPTYRFKLGASNQSLESSLVRETGITNENQAMSGYGVRNDVTVCPIVGIWRV